MKILVYGAGPLGSLFAARLHEAGHDVSILARGQRLAELREHGIVLVNAQAKSPTGQISHLPEVAPVNVVEQLMPEDTYELALVIMRKNKALEILPVLAANKHIPDLVFLMNNAAGAGEFIQALGMGRVMLGFPASAGMRVGNAIHYLSGTEQKKATIPLGEIDGSITERTLRVAEVLKSMRGFDVEIRTDMDAWLKSHVAVLMPGLAAALYACGTDNFRLARTPDGLVLGIRAVKEAFRGLQAAGYPIVPERSRRFMWIPEPLLVLLMSKLLQREEMQVGLVGHATAARDEVKFLVGELLEVIRPTGIPTPTIDYLYRYFDPRTPLIPEGSHAIPMDYQGVAIGLLGIAGIILCLRLLSRRSRS